MKNPAAGERPAHAALTILAELEALLREERRAVAAYDVAALERLGAAKDEAARRLAAATVPTPGSLGAGVADLDAFRAAARRVTALAEANALVLGASVAAVTDALGISTPVITYDSRARLRQRRHSAGVRVI